LEAFAWGGYGRNGARRKGVWAILSHVIATDLTRRVFLSGFACLQPKFGFLPEAGCGGTRFLEAIRGRGERGRATGSKATFKAKPVS